MRGEGEQGITFNAALELKITFFLWLGGVSVCFTCRGNDFCTEQFFRVGPKPKRQLPQKLLSAWKYPLHEYLDVSIMISFSFLSASWNVYEKVNEFNWKDWNTIGKVVSYY